jgi:hypothetical protein
MVTALIVAMVVAMVVAPLLRAVFLMWLRRPVLVMMFVRATVFFARRLVTVVLTPII